VDATTDWGITDTKADQFWTAFGVQGDGIKVANIDTGVQWNHPGLDQAFACPGDPGNSACWADPSNICGGTACDNNGHGTHTMGTMVSDDDPSLTYIAGMAPNSTWIACKGCEQLLPDLR
jgi:subtilisin family serine protease